MIPILLNRIAARAALFGSLMLCSCSLYAADFGGAALHLAGSAARQSLNRFSIEAFEAVQPAAPEIAAEAQLLLSEALFGLAGVGVMDAAVLSNLGARGRIWGQVVVRGAVYRRGNRHVLVARAFKLSSGEGLTTLQLELPERPLGEPPRDLRDAPVSLSSSCAGESEALRAENRGMVDIKARYWALQARSPGFSYSGLERPPGSELGDYRTLQDFYALSNSYYAQDAPVMLTAEERLRLEKLMRREAAVMRRCP